MGSPAAVESMRAKLASDHGVIVRYSDADMSRPEAVESMMKKALAEFGAIDILVNNAGIQHVAPIDEFPGRPLETQSSPSIWWLHFIRYATLCRR